LRCFWSTVCKTVRPILSDHCLSVLSCPICLSVCNVGVLWPNSWMDQDETSGGGMPRPEPHSFRWGPSCTQKGHSPIPIIIPCLLWPNGWMDQDATLYGSRPRPRQHCVRWGPSSPPPRKKIWGHRSPLTFRPCIVTKWLDRSRIKMPLGMEVGLGHGHTVLDGDPAPSPKRGIAPNFWPISVVAKRLGGSRCHLVGR